MKKAISPEVAFFWIHWLSFAKMLSLVKILNEMQEKLALIHNVIHSHIDINDEEWKHYSSMFTVKRFNRKDIIVDTGKICRNVYFINSGLIRVYFHDKEGNENTFHFSQEGSFVTDYESLMRKTPSNYTIQAMEDAELVVMSYDMLHDGFTSLRYGEKLGRVLIEHYFFLFSEKLRSMYTESPIERYQKMNQQFPGIFNRVPQHHIASYLNISSVHLSRLKNQSSL